MKLLSGRRGVGILYAYMLLGLGFLRAISPDFGHLASEEQELEGTFRFMHSRPRIHAESIVFFGGGSRGVATRSKKSKRERDRSRDASAEGSGGRSGRRSSGSGRSGERRNKTKPKQKLVQLSASGDILGRAAEPSPAPAAQEHPEPSAGPSSTARISRQHGAAPGNASQRSAHPVMTANLPGLDDDMLDVPVGLDVQEGGDFSSWFPDGLDDSLLQDCDFSGILEVPDDDLTQLGFM